MTDLPNPFANMMLGTRVDAVVRRVPTAELLRPAALIWTAPLPEWLQPQPDVDAMRWQDDGGR